MRRLMLLVVIACLAPFGAAGAQDLADLIQVYKSERRMDLERGGVVIASYVIALGDQPLGHKQQEGDERTPEGHYVIDWKNPDSAYHLSLRISYPNAADRSDAAAAGRNPGGDIFIHGQPNGWSLFHGLLQGRDWTDGCIAVSNEEIEEVWRLVVIGTPIIIHP